MDATLSARILQNVHLQCPGALDPVLLLELYNTMIDFCDTTDAWRQDVTINVVPNQTSYDLSAVSSTAEITRLIECLDENNTPVPSLLDVPTTLTLVRIPSTNHIYTATVGLKPNAVDGSGYPANIPDWITSKYMQVFIEGMIYRLMSQPAKPYSNSTMAVYHMRKFRDGCAVARAQIQKSNLYGGQAWRYPGIAPAVRK